MTLSGTDTSLEQVPDLASCHDHGYYITATSVELCPELCDQLSSSPDAAVSIAFTCNFPIK